MTSKKLTIALKELDAELMGDGVAILLQRDERRNAHSVTVTAEDLRRLLQAME